MVAPQTFLSSSIFLVVLSLIASWYITYCFALQLIIEYLYRLVSFCTLLSVTRKYRYSLFLSNAYCLSFCFAKYSCKRHRFESPSHFHLIVASLVLKEFLWDETTNANKCRNKQIKKKEAWQRYHRNKIPTIIQSISLCLTMTIFYNIDVK